MLIPGLGALYNALRSHTGSRAFERGCDKPGCGGLFGLRGCICGDFGPGMEPVDAHYPDRRGQHAVGVWFYPEMICTFVSVRFLVE